MTTAASFRSPGAVPGSLHGPRSPNAGARGNNANKSPNTLLGLHGSPRAGLNELMRKQRNERSRIQAPFMSPSDTKALLKGLVKSRATSPVPPESAPRPGSGPGSAGQVTPVQPLNEVRTPTSRPANIRVGTDGGRAEPDRWSRQADVTVLHTASTPTETQTPATATTTATTTTTTAKGKGKGTGTGTGGGAGELQVIDGRVDGGVDGRGTTVGRVVKASPSEVLSAVRYGPEFVVVDHTIDHAMDHGGAGLGPEGGDEGTLTKVVKFALAQAQHCGGISGLEPGVVAAVGTEGSLNELRVLSNAHTYAVTGHTKATTTGALKALLVPPRSAGWRWGLF